MTVRQCGLAGVTTLLRLAFPVALGLVIAGYRSFTSASSGSVRTEHADRVHQRRPAAGQRPRAAGDGRVWAGLADCFVSLDRGRRRVAGVARRDTCPSAVRGHRALAFAPGRELEVLDLRSRPFAVSLIAGCSRFASNRTGAGSR